MSRREEPVARPTEAAHGAPEWSETDLRIIEAAARLFSERGYDGVGTRAIATEAGVNEVTLFRHFGSKEKLLLAVVERFSALSGPGAAFEAQLSGDYRRDLLLIGRHYLETMNRNRRAILMTMFEAQRLPEVRRVIARPPARQRQMLGAVPAPPDRAWRGARPARPGAGRAGLLRDALRVQPQPDAARAAGR